MLRGTGAVPGCIRREPEDGADRSTDGQPFTNIRYQKPVGQWWTIVDSFDCTREAGENERSTH